MGLVPKKNFDKHEQISYPRNVPICSLLFLSSFLGPVDDVVGDNNKMCC